MNGVVVQVRRVTLEDAEPLAALLAAYLGESYQGHVGSTPDQLRRDVLSDRPRQQVLIVEQREHAVGFVAWNAVYDMHWAVGGAQVADLYVAPAYRGLGLAFCLLAQLAAEVRAEGGAFLRGGAYDRESTRRLYGRIAIIAPSGDTHLSGRAFRRFAELAGVPVRDLLANLPPRTWNLEP